LVKLESNFQVFSKEIESLKILVNIVIRVVSSIKSLICMALTLDNKSTRMELEFNKAD